MVNANLSFWTQKFNIDGNVRVIDLIRQIQASGKLTTGEQMFNICKLIYHIDECIKRVNTYMATLCTSCGGSFIFNKTGDIQVSFSSQEELDSYEAGKALLIAHQVQVDIDPITIPPDVLSSSRSDFIGVLTVPYYNGKLLTLEVSSYQINTSSIWSDIDFSFLGLCDSGESDSFNMSNNTYTVPKNTARLKVTFSLVCDIGFTGNVQARWKKNGSITCQEFIGSDVYYGTRESSLQFTTYLTVSQNDTVTFQVRQNSNYASYLKLGSRVMVERL